MRLIEDEAPQLHYIFYYLLKKKIDAIVSGDYDCYIELTMLFETIASPLLSKVERHNLREVKKAMKKYIYLIRQEYSKNIEKIKDENVLTSFSKLCEDLERYIEYRFSHLIARILMQALSKKCFEDIIPPDASKYNIKEEFQDLIEDLNIKLQTYGFSAPDLSDIQIRQKDEEVKEEWIAE